MSSVMSLVFAVSAKSSDIFGECANSYHSIKSDEEAYYAAEETYIKGPLRTNQDDAEGEMSGWVTSIGMVNAT